ncbi:MAG: Spy/CpxP family protein refolding chaperone [Acidovorax sp.]|uniref:Spy/CpxP family protein refolding chaperone n=1 Tax=Acidovorax sp. TaxID=1872122 RepID=UPI00391AC60F
MAFHFHRRIAATAVLAALALPVLAQQPPAAPSVPTAGATAHEGRHHAGERHHGQHGQKGGGKHQGNHAEYRAKHLAALKSDLKLTAAQEPAWTSFTTSMQPGERTARLDRKDMQQLTTPERIDRMRALRAQHAAEADRRGEVTKTFYAALTPEQQKTFDAKAHRGGHRMGGMKGSGGEGRHGHHGHHHGERGGAAGKTAAPAPAQ